MLTIIQTWAPVTLNKGQSKNYNKMKLSIILCYENQYLLILVGLMIKKTYQNNHTIVSPMTFKIGQDQPLHGIPIQCTFILYIQA